MNARKFVAALLLLLTTFFWGLTFTIVKEAIARVDVFVFLAQRFAIATLLMLPVAWLWGGRPGRTAFSGGGWMGVALFASYAFQTLALLYTSASNTGFLTGLSVVLVPVIGALVFRHPVAVNVRWGVALAVAGLFLLTTNGSWAFNRGDALGAVCAVCVALHLLLTGRYANRAHVLWLTTVQLGVVAAGSWLVALAAGHPVLVWHPFLLWPLVVCVLFATIFAFLVQTAMQRRLSPSHTALIFCMEPVFAALCAWWILGERLGWWGYMGAVFILAGMLLSELLPEKDEKELESLAGG